MMTTHCLTRRSTIFAALTLGAIAAHAGNGPTFERVGPEDYEVTDMSSDGSVVVGKFVFGSPAFRWTRDTGTQFIGGNGGIISVSSDGNTISGSALVDGHNEAALWLGGENWQPLGGLGTSGCPDFSNNYATSGNGLVIVGLGWNGCSASAFRWEQSTGMVDLGFQPGSNASRANGVNFDGSVIVGWDDAGQGRVGARWNNGVQSLLSENSEPDLFIGEAQATTPDGAIIVGGGAAPIVTGFYDQAYIWNEQRGARLIGKLPGQAGNARAFGNAVSNDGSLVAGLSGAQFREAFIWNAATGMVRLKDYLVDLGVEAVNGWDLSNARAMSGDGTKLAGWGINPNQRVQGWLVENLPPLADADSDGVFDALDNCTEDPNSDQRDTNGDGFGNVCDADLNNDMVINFADLGLMKAVFFSADEDADLDGDGSVSFVDLGIMKQRFFGVPGPSAQVP